MKKMYKLVIVYDTNNDDCDILTEYFDNIEEDVEILSIEEYANKDIRDELIKSQIMGEA